MTTMIWFQRDLRIRDNPTLNWAMSCNEPIIALYLHNDAEDGAWAMGGASRWWLHHSLESLRHDLGEMNIPLHCERRSAVDSIADLARQWKCNAVTWSRRPEPYRREIESQVYAQLRDADVKRRAFPGALLDNPLDTLNRSGKPYRVFTPFYKAIRHSLNDIAHGEPSMPVNWKNPPLPDSIKIQENVGVLQLLSDHPWHDKLHQHWRPGEPAAIDAYQRFLNDPLDRYDTKRDFPAEPGTSRLSPYLHFGEVDVRMVAKQLYNLAFNSEEFPGAESFYRQLIWREFARYTLMHFPHTAVESMDPRFADTFWHQDPASLEAWQHGKTGIPIVDAGMHELWKSGWMHNRVRMLAASVLTKNLGLHWRSGARWFWDTLVDADLANNTMGWQWVAGCGVDAAPYFRIFNPLTQAQRFDQHHRYSRHWLPTAYYRNPVTPIVDLAESRRQALDRFKTLRKSP